MNSLLEYQDLYGQHSDITRAKLSQLEKSFAELQTITFITDTEKQMSSKGARLQMILAFSQT